MIGSRKMGAPCRWSVLVIAVWLAACGRPVLASLDAVGQGHSIAFPSAHARLDFSEPGFDVQIADPHRPFYSFANERTGLDVSFRFDRGAQCTTSYQCRDLAALRWRETNPRAVDMQSGEIEGISYFEYTDARRGGIDLRQRHMSAHFVSAELWVDVRLTKVQYEESDRELFVRAIRAIRLGPI
jgi:hypothetical protein